MVRRFCLSSWAVSALFAFGACPYVPENPPPRCDDEVCTVEDGDALVSVVDATDDDRWVHFDFETAGAVDEENASWDLAFRRMVVKSNGGASGDGGVEVAVLPDAVFDEVTSAPGEGWMSDDVGDPDERDPGGTVFNEDPWYAYDLFSHSLQPQERVYVVRTVEGSTFKLRIDGYYDADGTSGWMHFTWSAVSAF